MTASISITFLPGAAGAGAFWTPLVERLPNTWQCRAIDLPGFGSIPARAGVNSYRDLVDYVAGTISAPTVLVAQSMGAYIALEIALGHPHLVTHLVLVAATGGVDVASHGAVEWRDDYRTTFPDAAEWARDRVPDLTDRLGEITVPVLLIWATADAYSPVGVAYALEASIKDTSLTLIESDDHWVVRQFPAEAAAAIVEFLMPKSAPY